MSAPSRQWLLYQEYAAYLAALDIVGFSKRLGDPQALLATRTGLIRAVEQTAFFQASLEQSVVWAHFLGDELRLAFRADAADARQVREFVENIVLNLSSSYQADSNRRASVVAVVLSGYMMAKEWRGCKYLHGVIAHKAQRWMNTKILSPGEIAVDSNFHSTETGLGAKWRKVEFGQDVGWVSLVAPE